MASGQVRRTIGWVLVVFAAGFGTAYLLGDHKVAALQQYSDSVTVVANTRLALAEQLAGVIDDTVAILVVQKRSAKRGADDAEARADSAHAELATALTAADSLAIREREVKNLRQSNDSLDRALTLAEATANAERARAEIFHDALHAQSEEIIRLNARIQALTPRTPKWLRVALRVSELAVAFKAGMEYAEARR